MDRCDKVVMDELSEMMVWKLTNHKESRIYPTKTTNELSSHSLSFLKKELIKTVIVKLKAGAWH